MAATRGWAQRTGYGFAERLTISQEDGIAGEEEKEKQEDHDAVMPVLPSNYFL